MELINFLMTKIFCVGQGNPQNLNKEYLVIIEVLLKSVENRNMFVSAL